MEKITGYGGDWTAFGDLRILGPRSGLRALLAVFLAVPGLCLMAAAARAGATGRDRRDALLNTLGASRLPRLCMDLGGALLPITLGTLSAAALIAPTLAWDIRLPWINYTLAAADMRAGVVLILISVIAAAASALSLVLILRPSPARQAKSNRPTTAAVGPLRLLALGAFPIFVVMALFSGSLLGGSRRSAAAYLFAVAGVWITLPWVLS